MGTKATLIVRIVLIWPWVLKGIWWDSGCPAWGVTYLRGHQFVKSPRQFRRIAASNRSNASHKLCRVITMWIFLYQDQTLMLKGLTECGKRGLSIGNIGKSTMNRLTHVSSTVDLFAYAWYLPAAVELRFWLVTGIMSDEIFRNVSRAKGKSLSNSPMCPTTGKRDQ
jgi:hypothetical protein